MKTVGERLTHYRKLKKMSKEAFSRAVHVSRPLVSAWENGSRKIQASDMQTICEVLGIDEGLLLSDVSIQNQTVAKDLGLAESSIEFLKNLNFNKDVGFLDPDFDEIHHGMVYDRDGLRTGAINKLILQTLNLLLSTKCGADLLETIGNYCFSDFKKGFPVFGDEAESDPAPVDFIRYRVAVINEDCEISVSLLRFALLKNVEEILSTLRENVQENVKGENAQWQL